MNEDLTEIVSRDVPEGAQVSGVREEALPARTWIKLGDTDGTEIYLDVDENVRALVRTIKRQPKDAADAPTVLRPGSVIEVRDPS